MAKKNKTDNHAIHFSTADQDKKNRKWMNYDVMKGKKQCYALKTYISNFNLVK